MKLLDKALDSRRTKKFYKITEITDAHVELALAWLMGHVEMGQVTDALKMKHNSAQRYVTLLRAIRRSFDEGKLIIND